MKPVCYAVVRNAILKLNAWTTNVSAAVVTKVMESRALASIRQDGRSYLRAVPPFVGVHAFCASRGCPRSSDFLRKLLSNLKVFLRINWGIHAFFFSQIIKPHFGKLNALLC